MAAGGRELGGWVGVCCDIRSWFVCFRFFVRGAKREEEGEGGLWIMEVRFDERGLGGGICFFIY